MFVAQVINSLKHLVKLYLALKIHDLYSGILHSAATIKRQPTAQNLTWNILEKEI